MHLTLRLGNLGGMKGRTRWAPGLGARGTKSSSVGSGVGEGSVDFHCRRTGKLIQCRLCITCYGYTICIGELVCLVRGGGVGVPYSTVYSNPVKTTLNWSPSFARGSPSLLEKKLLRLCIDRETVYRFSVF